ncbi:uncharacterized protein LOC119683390 [Teleopsis dalmanni]|uniref:uncharacterized protein LOC119683390 n=1 Tax=Teleopsis dalmanni TaxID=139649 RepID=UPI000D32CE0C|nr:uncharacterized protein LOC119683390 [Teleopsis dalmanni]
MGFKNIFAGVYIENKPESLMPVKDIDFEKNVTYLKQTLAEKISDDAKNLDLIYNGSLLEDHVKLEDVLKPDAMVFCIRKQRKPDEIVSKSAEAEITTETINNTVGWFDQIARTQINVVSRVNILQAVISKYPEFRHNLGAQAFIRDSVLFSTLNKREVIEKVAKTYPIIVEAARFIVSTVKKEITKENSSQTVESFNSDSTNSSEEENFTGPNSSGENSSRNESRAISRRQLQAALAQINFGNAGPGSNSVNSLSNIAERNLGQQSERNVDSYLLNPASTESSNIETPEGAPSESASQSGDVSMSIADNTDNDDDIPAGYRDHQYANELRIMAQMGFVSYDDNIMYLNITNGDIENAINILMATMT